jgi:hypothetical protein
VENPELRWLDDLIDICDRALARLHEDPSPPLGLVRGVRAAREKLLAELTRASDAEAERRLGRGE